MTTVPGPRIAGRRPRSASRRHAKQRGAIIVWFALFMMSMLSFVALGVDVAKLAATRTQLQNAADAAALAGASAVNPETGRIDADLAVRRAQQAGALNEAFIDATQPVVVDAADVQLLDDNQVRVTVRRQGSNSVVTSVARVLGIKSLDCAARATAQADTARTICNAVPLGITPRPYGQPLQVGCGHRYIFRIGNNPVGDGNYYPLLMPPCPEGPCATSTETHSPQVFECLVKNGYRCCISYKDWIFLEEAPMVGPIRNAIDDRFMTDTDRREGICYAQYRGNGRRVMFVPITTPPVGNDSGVWVHGLVAFFVQRRVGPGSGAALIGEFIQAVAPGEPGGSEGMGPVAYALHLVKGPVQ